MAYTATPTELRAYAQMQARLVALLLRYSERIYRDKYQARPSYEREDEDDELRDYRELAVIFYLRDELFEHILPRIVRRLSFESPRSLTVEEPPARGRIDWERTLDATWAERPGQPPLQLHTRQRRRDFATPENVLVVATLLEYRADIQRLLSSGRIAVGAEALRHPLNEIVERCTRELAFPQFAALRTIAERIVAGEQGGTDALEAQVEARALPGGNSAYDDLLRWRRRLRALRLLRRIDAQTPGEVLGADPKRDNYLYQLWIVYELADLLERRGLLEDDTALPRYLRFRWRDSADMCRYELRHDQEIDQPVGAWEAEPLGALVPGVRPDLYLRRLDPPEEQVSVDGRLYWREPGFVWDAKYYRETDRKSIPSGPIKRMIADLSLTGEMTGRLLFAFLRVGEDELPAPTEAEVRIEGATALSANRTRYARQLHPQPGRDQTIAPGPSVGVAPLRPDAPSQQTQVELVRLLDEAHAALREPRVPACHGIFLDTLSAGDRANIADHWGKTINSQPEDLLICPKPHIGAWRIDLVSRTVHCCKDPQLCHIVGRAGAQKPVRPPRNINDLLKELEHLLGESAQIARDDEAVAAIVDRVLGVTRSFADLVGVDFDFYFNRLRDLGMAQTLDMLGPVERESLALSEFLKDQLDRIKANDFSAPAIHISSVMEVEIKQRVFQCPGLLGDVANPKKQTLGTLPFLRLRRDDESDGNWQRILDYVAAHWDEHPDPDDAERVIRFDDLVTKAINRISQLRNTAAHTNPLSRAEYTELQGLIFQGGKLGFSALNAVLLGWRAI